MLLETVNLIRADDWRMACLQAVAALHLPDWYIAAGFLRNAIWDKQHHKSERTPLNDVDVVYFDAIDRAPTAEVQIQHALQQQFAEVHWEVRNQVRMHERNSHAPYRDSAHAIAHWVETPTCVGMRLESGGRFTVVAPYGLEENWALRVTPNPCVTPPAAVYNKRIREKRWREHWPKLEIVWAETF